MKEKRGERRQALLENRVSLFVLRTLVVCLAVIAWWECMFSVFPGMEVDRSWLYALTCLSALVIHAGMAGRWRKMALPTLACALVLLVWRCLPAVQGAAAHLVNGYLTVHQERGFSVRFWEERALSPEALALGTVVLVCVPLLVVLILVVRLGRGKLVAVLVFFIPVLTAVLEGAFPTAAPNWMLILAGGCYLTVAGAGGSETAGSPGAVWAGTAAAAVILLVLGGASVLAGRAVDVIRLEEEGIYLQAREAIQTGIVDNLNQVRLQIEGQDQEENRREEVQQPEETEEEQAEEDAPQPEEQRESPAPETVDGALSWDTGQEGMTELSSVAEFVPDQTAAVTVELEEAPTDTVYYPLRRGGTYTGQTWEETSSEDGEDSIFLSCPDNLNRLEELCDSLSADTVEEAEEQIDREVTQKAVYDTAPGRTPAGEDFAEYFLFESERGFCVHFATTATLMYRMMGYPVRYVEGYAIPASAFSRQEDGTYLAVADGTMGHAWCETFADGAWTVREHTPASGASAAPDSQEQASPEPDSAAGQGWLASLLAAGACAVGIFFLQAAVRRKKKYRLLGDRDRAEAVKAVYDFIYDRSLRKGMKEYRPLEEETCRHMAGLWESVREEEMMWLYQLVLESMFFHKCPSREEYSRAMDICRRTEAEMYRELKGWQKWKYKYIWCL